jgi:hypothetical protein
MSDLPSQLIAHVQSIPEFREVLRISEELSLPQWYFGAGAISQSFWNVFLGRPPLDNIRDLDWVYFDGRDLSEKTEVEIEKRLRTALRDLPLKIDVKNQARVHLWYEAKFGYPIPAYKSVYEAIETWPTTLTCVGLTAFEGKISVFAPYGLEDFFSHTVRANKRQITEEIYLKKVSRWKQCWPHLKVVSWADS